MKRIFKLLFMGIVIANIFLIFSINVFAIKPSTTVWIIAEKVPEGTVLIDLLIPIKESSKYYTSFNSSDNFKNTYDIGEQSEIVNYCEDGYYSYLFHVVDAGFTSEGFDYYFGDGFSEKNNMGNWEILRKFNSAKIAYCDKDGKILLVSNEFSMKNSFLFDRASFTLDNKVVKVGYHENSFMLIFLEYAIIIIIIVIITVVYRKHKKRKLDYKFSV